MPSPPTIADILRETVARLSAAGTPSPEVDADWILASLLSLDRSALHLSADQPVPPDLASRIEDAVHLRVSGHPLQYIVSETEFFSLPFRVDPNVLIPRPETECLVELVLERIRHNAAPRVLDVGTGSGAIAVALASVLPSARVIATDCSLAALHVARLNAVANGVQDRVHFLCGDVLGPIAGTTLDFDALVSNPPYIPTSDLLLLPKEVRDHEPVEALDGGPDGLDAIRRVVGEAGRVLQPGGWLALEVDTRYATQAAALIADQSGFHPPEIHDDLTHRPRVMLTRKLLLSEGV